MTTTDRGLIKATFADPHDILEGVTALRAKGMKVLDTYTPFPVHGMDDALGEPPSRLPWITGLLGLTGFTLAVTLQVWTSAVDYPLNVGGKPLISIPAFVPVCFELTVLLAALGSVAAFFFLSRMRPRLNVLERHDGVNDNRFVLIAELVPGLGLPEATALLASHHATAVERYLPEPFAPNPFWNREAGPAALVAGVILPPLAVFGLGLAFNRDFAHRVAFFDAGMSDPTSAQAFDPSPVLKHGQVLNLPPAGTMARTQALPLGFAPGKEEAERAGRELTNPLQPTPEVLARGAQVWGRVCGTCHGEGAKGDGGVIPKFPNPPNLLIQKYLDYPEGRLFHVATFGGPEKIMKGFADQVSATDRWSAVLHLRALQAAAAKARAAAAKGAPAPAPGVKP